MTRKHHNYLLKTADLEGEEMLKFRNGDSLWPFCSTCVYSAMTPITGVLGCTKGDDPLVKQYSADVETDQADPGMEKCPVLNTEENDIAETTHLASQMAEAGMMKDVPVEISMLENSLEDKDPVWNYDYVDGDENPGPERITRFASVDDVSALPERAEFFKFIDKMGVGKVQDENAKKQLITEALMKWRDGGLAEYVDPEFVEAVIADYASGRWGD